MHPIQFPGVNVTIGASQPQYVPLPARLLPSSAVPGSVEAITCWRLSWPERLLLLLTGRLWISSLVFGAFQPILPSAAKPSEIVAIERKELETEAGLRKGDL